MKHFSVTEIHILKPNKKISKDKKPNFMKVHDLF